MRKLQKIRSLRYLMIFFYIACYTILTKHQLKISNSNIVNNQSCKGTTSLKLKSESLEAFHVQNISDCLCSRKSMYPPTTEIDSSSQSVKIGNKFKRLNSSCSDEGTHYQANQNVITFSMFYTEEKAKLTKPSDYQSPLNYEIGLLQNLLMMRKHYPGFSVRVYTSVSLKPNGPFCMLICQNEDIFWCDIRKTPSDGDLSGMNFRTWRFLAMGDPTVNIFHSRDLDSLIGDREAAAVQDWLSNSSTEHKAIMAMRDRKGAHNFEMLAGMWSADNRKLIGNADKIRKQLILKSQLSTSQDKGFDQQFLASDIFYPMAKDILAFDSYHCVKWSNFTEVRPFPIQQKKPATRFVGNIFYFSVSGKPTTWNVTECPLECRPSYGLDWIYC